MGLCPSRDFLALGSVILRQEGWSCSSFVSAALGQVGWSQGEGHAASCRRCPVPAAGPLRALPGINDQPAEFLWDQPCFLLCE